MRVPAVSTLVSCIAVLTSVGLIAISANEDPVWSGVLEVVEAAEGSAQETTPSTSAPRVDDSEDGSVDAPPSTRRAPESDEDPEATTTSTSVARRNAPSSSVVESRQTTTIPAPATTTRPSDGAPVAATGAVARVVDGDTFELRDGTRVRIAIVDAPEFDQPCGPEASAFVSDELLGRDVVIFRPAGAPTHDPFDRLLGEVVRADDGWSLNIGVYHEGFGRLDERFASEDPDLASRIRSTPQKVASCQPATTTTTSAPPPAQPPATPPPTTQPPRATGCSGKGAKYETRDGSCLTQYEDAGGDVDCGQIPSSAKPVRVKNPGDDPYRLDRDNDGVGCEAG